jgi:hypothetical protein
VIAAWRGDESVAQAPRKGISRARNGRGRRMAGRRI